MEHDDDNPATFASPPCMAHELAEGYDGGFTPVDAEQRRDVARRRKAERERLIAARLACSADERRQWSATIAERVAELAGDLSGRIVSFYWPFRGEPDLRPLMDRVRTKGGEAALPVVIAKGQPLVFRSYRKSRTEVGTGVAQVEQPHGYRHQNREYQNNLLHTLLPRLSSRSLRRCRSRYAG